VLNRVRQHNHSVFHSFSIFTYRLGVSPTEIKNIHNNPIKEKWELCKQPEDYRFSSARYYLNGIDEFGFIKDF
jgi:hypothetical protein